MHSLQTFVQSYANLSTSNSILLSHEANKQLIALQQSQQSWNIAKQLIQNQKYHQHGCLLLTRKLTRVYTPQMEKVIKLKDFILQLPALNKLLWFALAKLAVHLAWQKIQLGKHLSKKNVIGVLSSIPEAAIMISLPPQQNSQDNQRSRANKILNNYKQFLVQAFNEFPSQICECLQNFVVNNYKLRNQNLVKLMLTRPLEQVSTTLQQILLGQKYQSLHNQIYSYLIKNQNNCQISQFFNVFIAFARSLPLLSLPIEALTGIFTKIITILKQQIISKNQQSSKDTNFISDSFDLWSQLSGKINKDEQNVQNTEQVQIIQSAFVQLWKIIIQKSLQKTIPQFIQNQKVDSLTILLDDEDDIEQIDQKLLGHNTIISNSFRQTSQDLLHMIFVALSKNNKRRHQCLSFVHYLTLSDNSLNLQLSVFVMSCIVQVSILSSTQQISELMQSITRNKHAKQPYIWQQLLKVLGKLGHDAVCDGAIFQTALIVLRQSILIQQLSVLACQTFNQILTTCQNSSYKTNQTPLLQQFFDYIYTHIYFKTQNSKVFAALTKSSIIFIYYFRPDLEYFQNYLKALNQKIESMKNVQDKIQIVQNLAIYHNFIQIQNSKIFSSVISDFFIAFLPIIIRYVQACPPKRLSAVFAQLSTILGIGAGFNTQIWVQMLVQLSKYQNVLQQKYLLINLFNKLISVQQISVEYQKQITKFIKASESFVNDSLKNSSQNDYRLINKCLTFHLVVLNKYVSKIQSYHPDVVINFILEKIYTGIAKFQMESSRTSLGIVRALISQNYHVQQLLLRTLKVYKQIFDSLWKSIEAILLEAYKKGGDEVYKKVFSKIYPTLAPPNPLFQSFMKAIAESRAKDYRNILISIK